MDFDAVKRFAHLLSIALASVVVGTIGGLGTPNPLPQRDLGLLDIEWFEHRHHRSGVLGECCDEAARHGGNKDIDLRTAQPSVAPGRDDLGPGLEAFATTGLARRFLPRQTARIGQPPTQRTGTLVTPQFVLIEPDLGLGHDRRKCIDVVTQLDEHRSIGRHTRGTHGRHSSR